MPTALILGATSDMAVAIARKLASEGYSLQLAARRHERLIPLQSDLKVRYSIGCSLHEFDAADTGAHQVFFDSLSEKPQLAVCVFGYMSDNEAALHNWSEAEKMIVTNYTGAVSILNIIGNYYASRKEGIIVGISSVAGERGRQSNFIYGSAKAGFTAYLSGLRNRLFREGVHVASIQPGFVYTRMTEHLSLPGLLTATPGQVAESVFKAITRRKNVVYVKWFWRWIMLIIRCIPEFMFKKLKL